MFEKKLEFNFIINQEILRRISSIDGFKATWLSMEKKDIQYLLNEHHIQSIEAFNPFGVAVSWNSFNASGLTGGYSDQIPSGF